MLSCERPEVSIVFATYNRLHLLKRSLVCYLNQSFPLDKLELVVIDDHSTDGTSEFIRSWSNETGVRTTVVTPCPKNESWRDCGAVLNAGIRASLGKNIILTHPEVMPGKQSISACVQKMKKYPRWYVCCKVYYLTEEDQKQLDTVDWKSKGVLSVREIPGFYEKDDNPNPDYTHQSTDIVGKPYSRLPTWESWVFGGFSRSTWKFLGGMLETQKWGTVDVAFFRRRQTLQITNYTCPEDDTIVVHQNHDSPQDCPTPRIEKVWMEELEQYNLSLAHELVWPKIDNLGWSD